MMMKRDWKEDYIRTCICEGTNSFRKTESKIEIERVKR